MATYLEAWKPYGPEIAPLSGRELTIGKSASNDLVLPDPTVSRLHAVVERYPSSWSVRDLGSRNGTFVNGDRILGERVLKSGDEIRVGQTRLIFRTDSGHRSSDTVTEPIDPAPAVTRREQDVLEVLCRPGIAGGVYMEPASMQEIAEELFLSVDAVKKHLQSLYRKFGLRDVKPRQRRATLATEALRRGAVGGVTRPGVSRPGVTRPGVSPPGVTRPGVSRPGVSPPR